MDRVEYFDIATGASGEIYTAGQFYELSGITTAVFRRSINEGRTWETMASPLTPSGSSSSSFTRVCANRSGRVYALRQVSTGQTSHFELWWAAGGAGGSNLALVTTFDLGYDTIADIAVDAAGNA